MADKGQEFEIVTEVGVFGDLNIEDPTRKKVNKKNEDIDELIMESTQSNLKNLSGRK
jgi:hypothetical protein